MKLNLKRVAAVTAVGAAGVVAPAASASAAPAPLPVPKLLAFPLLPAAAFAPVPLTFQGPQVAIGPTVIGSVFNGGTAVVVTTDPPVGSGNVIGSP